MENNYKMVAKTFFGFEDILADELRNLGAMHITKGVRSVQFEGDKGFMYKANLCLRTALKILKPIASFYVRSEKEYYQKLYDFNWQTYLRVDQTFAVTATLQTELFNHSQYVALKAKDAIADAFRNATGRRPNVDVLHPDLEIHIHIQRNEVIVSLDSSGNSLHQRGYRTATNIAPINEVLAAGILLLSGWQGQCDFLDPMCGSGTFLIEAAMIACNIPANVHRKEFAFERWNDFDEDLFNLIFGSCIKKIREFHHQIVGYDKAPSAVAKAKDNLKNADLSEYIQVFQKDFFATEKEDKQQSLHMVFNPPYNERLQTDVEQLYSSIGNTLKHHYPNTDAWFITSNLEGIKYVGLRPSRKIKLFNGKLESRLLQYKMYEGSKKAKKQAEE
ncbi:THUMP domain protein [Capnocytophaga ochracea F0287]|uniref:THUMP domain protein n=1 Tax=Capnocytophaga ochracea F0287 TaxID=873517 RepID=E4MV96_CAPOC|nr:THUMP domain-containing protein [Capnocytophaga ochracea]EFS96390.1 THUMP domain protein [Capnocytophaga ochracea F0287]EJF44628.1 RNA methylase, PF01170 family [Capnocytophaga ochracea str. Holt 25]UEB43049.1 THUMP domain-containing protein [Capnocytophaga ochracea]